MKPGICKKLLFAGVLSGTMLPSACGPADPAIEEKLKAQKTPESTTANNGQGDFGELKDVRANINAQVDATVDMLEETDADKLRAKANSANAMLINHPGGTNLLKKRSAEQIEAEKQATLENMRAADLQTAKQEFSSLASESGVDTKPVTEVVSSTDTMMQFLGVK